MKSIHTNAYVLMLTNPCQYHFQEYKQTLAFQHKTYDHHCLVHNQVLFWKSTKNKNNGTINNTPTVHLEYSRQSKDLLSLMYYLLKFLAV